MPNPTPIAPYKPLDWQLAPLRDKSPTLLLTGSAGGGKSKTGMEKVHAFALHYPSSMGLLLRKVKASMINSTVLSYSRRVVGPDPRVRHYPSKSRFEYSNGSIVAYAGLDDEEARERLKSIGEQGGVDIALMEEGSEFDEGDYNLVITRMRGTAVEQHYFMQFLAAARKTYGKHIPPEVRASLLARARDLGWQQVIVATNPDSPQHWIFRRLMQNSEASVYYSSHEDNSYNPQRYEANLNRLTGIDRDRLVLGKWVQATGLIYDTFSLEENVTDQADYVPGGGSIFWAVDDGYAGKRDEITGLYTAASHPRVFLFVQQRADGSLLVFDEHHGIHKLSDQHIAEVLALGYDAPEYAAVDKSAAELKSRLFNESIYTRNGPATVEESIKVLRRMLAPDANGWRRIRIHPRCRLLISEMGHYRRDANGRPIKEYDHALDALRYLAWHFKDE